MKNTIKSILCFIATIPFSIIFTSLPEEVSGENGLGLIIGNVILIYFGVKYSRK